MNTKLVCTYNCNLSKIVKLAESKVWNFLLFLLIYVLNRESILFLLSIQHSSKQRDPIKGYPKKDQPVRIAY